MEASMHGTLERPGKADKPIELSPVIRFLLIPALLAIAVVALAINQPDVSRWISDAAQAEFANTGPAPEIAPAQAADVKVAHAKAR
jgi:hypothetical protein